MHEAFITYAGFEQRVAALTSCTSEFKNSKHFLPAIPWHCRQRFLDTMNMGLSITDTYDCIMSSLQLPDENYMRYVTYTRQPKHEATAPAPQNI